MGNSEVHGLPPMKDVETRSLDLSQKVNHKFYCKHVGGDYSSSCLTELPWALQDCISLYERVDVSFNCVVSLPQELPFRLPHLAYLNLSHNRITSLPDSINLLYHLRELLVPHNCLQELPTSIVKLARLQKLDLSHNVIEELPEDIGTMKSLVKLNVSNNTLKLLPRSLGSCQTLRVLLAKGNLCEHQPPQSVCDQGSAATLKFLAGVLPTNDRPLCWSNNINTFSRVRGNQVQTSVPNPHSARAQYAQIQTETINTASRIRTPLLPPFDATTFEPDELRNRIIGLIYGAVIGDALGVATEFLSQDECQFHYNEDDLNFDTIICDDHRVRWTKGDWTSNSDQMFLVLDSLLHWAGVVDELEFAKRLVAWKKSGFPDLQDTEGYTLSHTINLVLQEESYAVRPHFVAQQVRQRNNSNGITKTASGKPFGLVDNGALSRAAVLGIPRFHDLEEVASNSIRICLATHSDERCRAACVVVSTVLALILQGRFNLETVSEVEKLISEAQTIGRKQLNSAHHREKFDKYFVYKTFESIHLDEVGRMSHSYKAMAAGLVALRSTQDFQRTVSAVIMQGGHSSMNACIAGAFVGCRTGFSHLPRHWVHGLLPKQCSWMNDKINGLLDMMGLP